MADEKKSTEAKVETNINENGVACNPSLDVTELQGEDLEKMKGDAIGDTLYSERFVLNTLLKLTKIDKDLNENEEFEKDLCNLWDMTIEKDVVKLLLEHNVLELFSNIVVSSEDKRLTEVLIGITANMCNISETRQQLCNNAEILGPIIDLISCSDSLTLIQLMRLFHASLVFENSGDEIVWFQHFKNANNFVEHFAFILKNSINKQLLIHSLEALNAICAKFAVIEIQPDVQDLRFCDVFVKSNLVSGVIEAFKTLVPQSTEIEKKNDGDEVLPPSQNTKKIMSLFLDLNVILSQYDEVSKECYEQNMNDLLICVSQILTPLCSSINLLPLTFNEQGIVENLNEIFLAIGDPYDENIFIQMTTIWDLIETDQSNKYANQDDEWSGDNDSEEEINAEDMCMTILEFLTRTVKNATDTQIQNSIKLQKSEIIQKLIDALSTGQSEDDIRECYEKVKINFELIKEKSTKVCNGDTNADKGEESEDTR